MNNLAIAIQWISLIGFIAYYVKKYGELDYYSTAYYKLLSDGKQSLFYFSLAGIGLPIFIISDNWLAWVAGVLLVFVGGLPKYKNMYQKYFHPISAWGSGLFGMIWIYTELKVYDLPYIEFWPITLFALFCGIIFLMKKYIGQRIEWAIFFLILLFETIISYN